MSLMPQTKGLNYRFKGLFYCIKTENKSFLENGGIGIFLVLIFLSLFLNIRLAFWVAF